MSMYMLTDYHEINFPLGTLDSLLSIDSKKLACLFIHVGTLLVAQMAKHLPTMWETCVRSLVQEDPLEKEMATHSSNFAWRIPWTEEQSGLQSVGLHRVGHDSSNLAWHGNFSFRSSFTFLCVIQVLAIITLFHLHTLSCRSTFSGLQQPPLC